MTTYTTASDIIAGPDSTLRKQVRGALLKLALDIRGEPDDTAYHALRLRWAQRVWASPDVAIPTALAYCALSAGIRTKYEASPTNPATTDAEVEAVLSAALPAIIAETV